MKQEKKGWALALAMLLVFSVSLFAGGSQEAAPSGDAPAKKYVFSSELPTAHMYNKAYNKFADELEALSGGRITMEVYDSSSIASAREALEGIKIGTIHATGVLEAMSFYVPEMEMMGIPYLFRDMDHVSNFMKSPAGMEFQQRMIDAGFRPVAYFLRTSRQMTSNKKIASLADLKGTKLRVPETSTGPAAWNAMGAKTVTMPFGEVFSALQQGVIDAQENTIDQIVSSKFHEVQKYVSMTNHQFQASFVVFSEKEWQSLSEADRQIVQEAANRAKAFETELRIKETKEAEDFLKTYGTEILYPDTNEFAKAASEAYKGYSPLMQEWVKKVQAVK